MTFFHRTNCCFNRVAQKFSIGFCAVFFLLALLSALPASGHELWLETAPHGTIDQDQKIDLCWGHSGVRYTGRSLESQGDKISSRAVQPDGKTVDLKHTLGTDSFITSTPTTMPGFYQFGAEVQTGIIDRPLHSIPEKSRIIMYGKTSTQVGESKEGMENTLGQDLEIALLTPPADLKPGGIVKAKLLLHGKPLGGKDVKVTLSTVGSFPLSKDPRISSHEWTSTATPDEKYGEMAFQLITSGQHVLSIKYYDETPGTYDGDRNDKSDFSHLQKRDTFERTFYISTLTFQVPTPQ